MINFMTPFGNPLLEMNYVLTWILSQSFLVNHQIQRVILNGYWKVRYRLANPQSSVLLSQLLIVSLLNYLFLFFYIESTFNRVSFLLNCSLGLPRFCPPIFERDKQVFPTIFPMQSKIFWNITVIYLVLFGLVFIQDINNIKLLLDLIL